MPETEKAHYDGEYYNELSLYLDIKIFFKTLMYFTKNLLPIDENSFLYMRSTGFKLYSKIHDLVENLTYSLP